MNYVSGTVKKLSNEKFSALEAELKERFGATLTRNPISLCLLAELPQEPTLKEENEIRNMMLLAQGELGPIRVKLTITDPFKSDIVIREFADDQAAKTAVDELLSRIPQSSAKLINLSSGASAEKIGAEGQWLGSL